jgi:Nop14-like family
LFSGFDRWTAIIHPTFPSLLRKDIRSLWSDSFFFTLEKLRTRDMKDKKHSKAAASMPAKGGRVSSKKPPVQKKAFENPFDKFANARKKHEVINRRVKGEDRNVGRARKKALETRKNRLVDDYASSKKSNVFADR